MRSIRNAILLVAGLPGMALLATAPARAQTYFFNDTASTEIYTIDGSSIDCSFTSIAQCAATASGQSAQCYANPYALRSRPPGPGPSPPRRNR